MVNEMLDRLPSWRAARGWVVGVGLLIALAIVLRLTVFAPPAVAIGEVTRGNLAEEVEGTGPGTSAGS